MSGYNEPDEPGFDPGPDGEDEEVGACDYCDEQRVLTCVEGEDLCADCIEGMSQAAADSRAERNAERRAMACDLGTGPSDDWRD
jgi:hypothetical protein